MKHNDDQAKKSGIIKGFVFKCQPIWLNLRNGPRSWESSHSQGTQLDEIHAKVLL